MWRALRAPRRLGGHWAESSEAAARAQGPSGPTKPDATRDSRHDFPAMRLPQWPRRAQRPPEWRCRRRSRRWPALPGLPTGARRRESRSPAARPVTAKEKSHVPAWPASPTPTAMPPRRPGEGRPPSVAWRHDATGALLGSERRPTADPGGRAPPAGRGSKGSTFVEHRPSWPHLRPCLGARSAGPVRALGPSRATACPSERASGTARWVAQPLPEVTTSRCSAWRSRLPRESD